VQRYVNFIASTTSTSSTLMVLSNANCTVYVAGTSTAATLYSDNGITPLANPFLSSSTGQVAFYAANGTYDLVVSKIGYLTVTISAIELDDLMAPSGSNSVGYLPAGTGAVATTVQTKLRESVSVKDFGAVGDGTTDDTAAIQAALNAALAAGGGAVTLVRGLTYKVTSKISIPSNCGLLGDGTSTIYAPAANFSNASLTNRYASNSAVIDMSGQTGSPYTANANSFLIGVKIQSQVSQGRCVDAVVVRNATSAVVMGCEIYGFPIGCGIKGASLSGETVFANNYIHDFLDNTTAWVGTPQSTAIEIDGDRVNSVYSFGVKILNNEIKQIQLGAAAVTAYGYQTDGINIQSIAGADFIVTGNRVIDVGEGIDHWGERSVISNNSFTNTYGYGIKLLYGASYNAIQGNVIYNTGVSGIVLAGSNTVGVGNVTQNDISGNVITNVDYLGVWAATTATAGIKVDNSTGAYSSRVTNNLFANNSMDSVGKYGVITGTDPDKNIFINNRILTVGSLGWVGGAETTPIYDALRTNVRAFLNAAQSIPAATFTKIQFNSKTFDLRTEYDATTNYRWTCQLPGIYAVTCQVRFTGIAANKTIQLDLYRNGGTQLATTQAYTTGADQSVFLTSNVQCAVGDYLEIQFYQGDTVARNITGATNMTYLCIQQT